ncbi:hypothetical protein GS397_06980 [Sphingobium yanoikuyae]|uniref:Uncharacterized protein n=1 Tax=Sphingobium yanoikuyae TaxID=13690 RepID=A0A6P1GF26_SPHYA|nr:hypothetical protein [Sphingobium yanoikuyae]QHD66813.1 hypothetical protein GS397_06980 [Sphingobium yanoikuyae]
MSNYNSQWISTANYWVFQNCEDVDSASLNCAFPLGTCERFRVLNGEAQFADVGSADVGYMEYVAKKLLNSSIPHGLGLVEAVDLFSGSIVPVKQFAVMIPPAENPNEILAIWGVEWDRIGSLTDAILGDEN